MLLRLSLTVKGKSFDLNTNDILSTTEILTQESFGTLQTQRFAAGKPFYIAIIEENGKYFAFDAPTFLRFYILTYEKTEENLPNPFTRKKIEEHSIKIFESTKKSPAFKQKLDISSVKEFSDALPIILSDPDLSQDKRSFYKYLLGNSLLKKLESVCLKEQPTKTSPKIEKMTKAITLLEQAAHTSTKGDNFHSERKYEIAQFFRQICNPQKHLYWLISYWNDFDTLPSNEGLIELGNAFQMNNKWKRALTFYKIAATKGNKLALAKIIEYYDEISSSKKRKKHATFWREYLPKSWKKKKMDDYMKYLYESKAHVKETQKEIPIPNNIKVQFFVDLNLPDPNKLFPCLYTEAKKIETKVK